MKSLPIGMALLVLTQSPSMAQGRNGEAIGMPGSGCSSKGRIYPEGTHSEGSSPENLCLPYPACPTASVILSVFQCNGGQWRCVRNCR
jgi:hypothetical protein